MRVAALTMAYNEPVWARVWARYYARQVGAAHCYMLDHGSEDGSTEGLGIHVEPVTRSVRDEDERAARISARAARLLAEYDAVVHSDVDELVVADPSRFADLRAYAEAEQEAVVTAVGVEVQHLPGEEPPLAAERPIGEQRRYVRFSAAMCKPVFVRRPVQWSPGFHRCDAAMVASGLLLFHLRYADLELGLRRLEATRGQEVARVEAHLHQRVSNEAFTRMVENVAQLPRECVSFSVAEEPLAGWIGQVQGAQMRGEAWLNRAGDRLWRIPAGWRDAF